MCVCVDSVIARRVYSAVNTTPVQREPEDNNNQPTDSVFFRRFFVAGTWL